VASEGRSGRVGGGWSRAPAVTGSVATIRSAQVFYARFVKRAVDIAVALVALIVAFPVAVIVTAAVLLTMGRPVFFRQERIGKDGHPFVMLKFRTMLPDRRRQNVSVAFDHRSYHKSEDDPRHTRIGRALRRTSLDELPQLLNILRGDMSLVGPRPELPHIVAGYEPWQRDRHLVRPGLTGLWQICARGDGRMHDFTQYDIAYIRRVSFRRDAMIVARTIPALLTRHGG
jgi:lipopolysaccharide/colanic/teichoic acid biosynthesis glycosyltransferase